MSIPKQFPRLPPVARMLLHPEREALRLGDLAIESTKRRLGVGIFRKKTAWVLIDSDNCTGCGICLGICMRNCLEFSERPNGLGRFPVRYKGQGCSGDRACDRACPEEDAIAVRLFEPARVQDPLVA